MLRACPLLLLMLPATGLAQAPVLEPLEEDAAARGVEVVLPVFVHVLLEDADRPVVDHLWLGEQIEWANVVFEPAGIAFEVVGYAPLDRRHAQLHSRTDRHVLARHLRRHVINVFVVEAMRDVDDPWQMRRGVHWKLPLDPGKHWVVLSATRAPPTTLAHELGHYFGNRRHSLVPGNIMSYVHGDAPELDFAQIRMVRRTAREQLRRRELSTLRGVRALQQRGPIPTYQPRLARASRRARRHRSAPRPARTTLR